MTKINYGKTSEFLRDFKKLIKKFPSLKDDLVVSKRYSIELFHEKDVDNNGIFEIQGIGNTGELRFFKIKKFQCKSLKGRGAKSGIRVIYAYMQKEKKIFFLEIYFKGSQQTENRQRIKDFLRSK